MKFINELREGEKISGIYLCKHKQSAVTKNGKPYETVILQDKTGTVDGKIWDPNSAGIDDFDSLDYIEVYGDVTCFQGANQINIKRIRLCREGEYEPANYLPVSVLCKRRGVSYKLQKIFRSEKRTSWICRRSAGAHPWRCEAVRLFCKILPDVKKGSAFGCRDVS